MQCRELREIADSYLAEELLVETNHEVLRHLEACPACRAEVIARRQLRATLQQAFAAAPALRPDPELVTRLSRHVQAATAVRPAPSRRRLAAWWAVAAGLILGAVTGGAVWRSATRGLPGEANPEVAEIDRALRAVSRDAAGDHRDCALHFRLAEAPISLEDAARLYDARYRKLDEAVRSARDAQGQPFEFVEAHVCVFAGRRFAHMVLRRKGRLVSILVTGRAVSGEAGARAVVALPEVEGFRAAGLTAPRHSIYVVSELDGADNLDVARAIAGPVYQHLAGA